ncbi:hypothetical protein ACHWQZ_G001432 [Mnemiopsis leidyi]
MMNGQTQENDDEYFTEFSEEMIKAADDECFNKSREEMIKAADDDCFNEFSEEMIEAADEFYNSFCSAHSSESDVDDGGSHEDAASSEGEKKGAVISFEEACEEDDCYDEIEVSDEEIERLKRLAAQQQVPSRKRARVEESHTEDKEVKLTSVQVAERNKDHLTFALFDLETDGLVKLGKNEIPNILQIGVKKIKWAPDITTTENYTCYITPTRPVSCGASSVNNLYSNNGKLYRLLGGRRTELDTISITEGLVNMWRWIFRDCSNVVLVGFNNQNFDNHVLSHHTRVRCDHDSGLMEKVKGGVMFSDVWKILKSRGISGNLTTIYRMSNGPELRLHEAMSDCQALCHVIKSRGITRDTLRNYAISMETVLSESNLFAIEKLMTPNTAHKVGTSISYSEYLRMPEEELVKVLKSLKVHLSAIRSCVRKRTVYGG